MNAIVSFIAGFYALGIIVVIVLIIFLLIRRRKLKDREDFEERDN